MIQMDSDRNHPNDCKITRKILKTPKSKKLSKKLDIASPILKRYRLFSLHNVEYHLAFSAFLEFIIL